MMKYYNTRRGKYTAVQSLQRPGQMMGESEETLAGWTQSRICVLLSRYFSADLTPNSSRLHLLFLLLFLLASSPHLVHLLHPALLSFIHTHCHLPFKLFLHLTTSHYFFHIPFHFSASSSLLLHTYISSFSFPLLLVISQYILPLLLSPTHIFLFLHLISLLLSPRQHDPPRLCNKRKRHRHTHQTQQQSPLAVMWLYA